MLAALLGLTACLAREPAPAPHPAPATASAWTAPSATASPAAAHASSTAPSASASPASTRTASAPTRTLPAPTPGGLTPAAPSGYRIQAGDTLRALAARFEVTVGDLQALNPGLSLTQTLAPGQLLNLPQAETPHSVFSQRLLPDSEVVYSPPAAGFDVRAFVLAYPGFLARYVEVPDGEQAPRAGWEIVQAYALDYSLHPRLLLALLEHQSQALTAPVADEAAQAYPLRATAFGLAPGLSHQLGWAANRLNYHYYRWRQGAGPRVWWPGGEFLRVDGGLNAGTYALAGLLAELYPRPEVERHLSPEGFLLTYRRLFGSPQAHAADPLIPAGLAQPEMQLPFEPGRTWYYTGGPHPGWGHTLPWSALDFAPPAGDPGCKPSSEWVTAARAGVITRSAGGLVEEAVGEGWSVIYLHIATADRVETGAQVSAGERLGHPSCEGGNATAVHVHIARKFNGEWMAADGPAPFRLSGWVAGNGVYSYQGTLARGDRLVVACPCGGAGTAVQIEAGR